MQMPFRRQPDARDDLDAIGNQTDALGQMIERELAQYVPKANGLPPLELVPREGRVSVDDIVADFQKTSDAVTKMGAALEGLARANDETSHYIRECVDYVTQLAEHYTREGERVAKEIGERKELAEEVRRQCDALMQKIAPPRESRE
jgi:hypothetical protein